MVIRPALIEIPVPITTTRLVLRPPKPGEGKICSDAIHESFDELREWMPWAQNRPSVDDTEEFVGRLWPNGSCVKS